MGTSRRGAVEAFGVHTPEPEDGARCGQAAAPGPSEVREVRRRARAPRLHANLHMQRTWAWEPPPPYRLHCCPSVYSKEEAFREAFMV